jgi:hypothetical protein
MRAWLRPRFWRALRYRLGVVALTLAYLLAALDIPLPASIHKESSQPFPCQDHPCGCRTAEQCWRSCCCFTPEQRWAWARAHQVEPPAYAEKPAATGWNTVKLRDRDRPNSSTLKRSCCQQERTCCATPAAGKSCCQTDARRTRGGDRSSPADKGRVRYGSAMTAWTCQGLSTLWVGIGAVLPVPPAVAWSPEWPLTARCRPLNEQPDPRSHTPPTPPPRSSLL